MFENKLKEKHNFYVSIASVDNLKSFIVDDEKDDPSLFFDIRFYLYKRTARESTFLKELSMKVKIKSFLTDNYQIIYNFNQFKKVEINAAQKEKLNSKIDKLIHKILISFKENASCAFSFLKDKKFEYKNVDIEISKNGNFVIEFFKENNRKMFSLHYNPLNFSISDFIIFDSSFGNALISFENPLYILPVDMHQYIKLKLLMFLKK